VLILFFYLKVTFKLLLKFVLPFNHLNVSLVGDSQGFEVLVNFSEFVCILLESFLEFTVDFLHSDCFFFLFKLLDSESHSFPLLFRSLLFGDDLLLVFLILFLKEGG
jgi:hypothetical protein